MNESTEQLIRELAEKLGTTTEYLWEILVKQAPVQAVTSSVMFLLSGIFLVACAWAVAKLIKRDGMGDQQFGALLVVVFLSVIWAFALYTQISLIVSGFLNPEYWALKQLLQ